jgi:hypothetical protein
VHRDIQGISTVVFAKEADVNVVLAKLEAALTLMANVAPQTLRRLSGHCRYILCLRGLEVLGAYIRPLRTCLVSLDYVERTTSPAQFAVVVVHEAMHARLHQAGVRPGFEKTSRIERACIRAEVRFAIKVPGGEALHAWSLKRLAALAPN